nr:MAG TPA: hypothetical protein [Caudoviricetes sp.]
MKHTEITAFLLPVLLLCTNLSTAGINGRHPVRQTTDAIPSRLSLLIIM